MTLADASARFLAEEESVEGATGQVRYDSDFAAIAILLAERVHVAPGSAPLIA
jgi:hypothetical protein|tara:strand:- start:560 stop:718 length:159 start_codon:yes stop_codon:yes gene_type:complete